MGTVGSHHFLYPTPITSKTIAQATVCLLYTSGPWFKSKRKSKVENLDCKHSSLAQSVRASDC